MLAVGARGRRVEELDRVAVSVPPLDIAMARELVLEAGVIDSSDGVASTLVALGRLALAYPEIESIDVNPLILAPAGPIAVDALVVVAERVRD